MHLLLWLGGGAAALLALGALAQAAWRGNRRLVVIVNAVQELIPDGGASIKDTVDRTERKVTRTERKIDETATELHQLREQFDAHLTDHSTT